MKTGLVLFLGKMFGDEMLLVCEPAARRLLDSTLLIDATREYVLHGRYVPSSWIWRLVTRRSA